MSKEPEVKDWAMRFVVEFWPILVPLGHARASGAVWQRSGLPVPCSNHVHPHPGVPMSKSPTAKAKYKLRQESLARAKLARFWKRQRAYDAEQVRRIAHKTRHDECPAELRRMARDMGLEHMLPDSAGD